MSAWWQRMWPWPRRFTSPGEWDWRVKKGQHPRMWSTRRLCGGPRRLLDSLLRVLCLQNKLLSPQRTLAAHGCGWWAIGGRGLWDSRQELGRSFGIGICWRKAKPGLMGSQQLWTTWKRGCWSLVGLQSLGHYLVDCSFWRLWAGLSERRGLVFRLSWSTWSGTWRRRFQREDHQGERHLSSQWLWYWRPSWWWSMQRGPLWSGWWPSSCCWWCGEPWGQMMSFGWIDHGPCSRK